MPVYSMPPPVFRLVPTRVCVCFLMSGFEGSYFPCQVQTSDVICYVLGYRMLC